MAIGISLMFNIRLPINFNSPYKARDIQDFWRRWHITLTRFLRDYIYIPLGGNKVSSLRNYLNLFTVFFIGGIWHGASWMFVIWGVSHGFAIVIHRIWKDLGFRMWGWLGWVITFNFVNIAWVFFRAKDWSAAHNVLAGMIGLNGILLPESLAGKLGFLEEYSVEFGSVLSQINGATRFIGVMLLFLAIILYAKNSNQMAFEFKKSKKNIFFVSILLLIVITLLARHSEFLYFRF
jgi:D-alanyl-lipoteichoic acid acyltransferase DltB (MBOAT superfamily)